MKNHNECEHIRGKIEQSVIGDTGGDRSLIDGHLRSCNACREYQNELEALHGAAVSRYSLSDHERIYFSANVRTRIEEKKSSRKQTGFIARPAFQIAAMLVIVAAVTLYMVNSTGPEEFYAFSDDDIGLIDPYSIYYDDIPVTDDAVIARLYAETIFDNEFYFNDYFDHGMYGFEFYDDIDDLSAEEIDYIIQRLEEV